MKKNQKIKNLDQSISLEIYKKYLSTEREDFNKKICRPIRSAIFKAMCGIHTKKNEDAFSLIDEQIKKGKRIFFWSDLHINHYNIIEFQKRPFNNIIEMNETMYSNYYQEITDDDLVVFGGDVAFGDVLSTADRIRQLPGKKILVMGNHEFDRNKNIYREYHAFDATVMSFVYQKEIEGNICNIIVSHYPIANSFLPDNTINIHGHIHSYLADKKNINMAVEHTGYKPIILDEKIKEVFLTHC